MANSLTNILPKILARGLMVLREQAVMPRIVNSDFSVDAAKKGDVINVPISTAVTVIDVAPANTPPSPSDTTPSVVQINLDQWKQTEGIHLTDKELNEIDKNEHFLPLQMGEGMRALSNQINLSILEEYKGVFGAVGAAGVTPFASAVDDAVDARKLLNQQLSPRDPRWGVLDFDAEANALKLAEFSDADKVGSAIVKMEGEIGRKFGINWLTDDQIITHVAGTLTDGANPEAITNGVFAAGVSSVDIDETSLTGTIVVGDIITFAGNSQTHAVIANSSSPEFAADVYTAASNAITGLTFQPALPAEVLDGVTMTLTQTHVVNLVFHRDAFAYATRPLIQNTQDMGFGNQIVSMQDPKTGLVLRLEVSRQHKQTVWEFDALWGSKLVRPELATRILG